MLVRLAAALSGPALLLGGLPFASHPRDERPAPPVVVPAALDPGRVARAARCSTTRSAPEDRQYALIRHIDAEIDRADAGATVRLAAYSFAMPSTAQALLRAHRRGVVVQVVVDRPLGGLGVGAEACGAVLGTDTGKRTASCRLCRPVLPGHDRQPARQVRDDLPHRARRGPGDGRVDELHRRTPPAKQWQDLYSVAGDARLYHQLIRVFALMARDEPQPRSRCRPGGPGFRRRRGPAWPARAVTPCCAGSAGSPAAARPGAPASRGRTVRADLDACLERRRGASPWPARSPRLARARGATCGCSPGSGSVPRSRGILDTRQASATATPGGPAGHTHEKLMFVSGHFAGRPGRVATSGPGRTTGPTARCATTRSPCASPAPRAVAAYRHELPARIWRRVGRALSPKPPVKAYGAGG